MTVDAAARSAERLARLDRELRRLALLERRAGARRRLRRRPELRLRTGGA